MDKRTVRQVVMITPRQSQSLRILKQYNVNVSQFIRQAIKEKLARDWASIKESENKNKCPF
jgi:post-segregation antitoxin (ccd killing protein)